MLFNKSKIVYIKGGTRKNINIQNHWQVNLVERSKRRKNERKTKMGKYFRIKLLEIQKNFNRLNYYLLTLIVVVSPEAEAVK